MPEREGRGLMPVAMSVPIGDFECAALSEEQAKQLLSHNGHAKPARELMAEPLLRSIWH